MSDFTYIPAPGSMLRKQPRVLRASFGDGYVQRIADGINTSPAVWDLIFNVAEADADTIEAIFEAFDGVDAFTWTPPGNKDEITVICSQWSRGYPDYRSVSSITCVFEQVFDIGTGTITALNGGTIQEVSHTETTAVVSIDISPSGGVAPRTHIFQHNIGAGFVDIPLATGSSVTDTGLFADTDTLYRLATTDDNGDTEYSPTIVVHTDAAAVTAVAFDSVSPASPSWVAAATNDISVVIPATTRGVMMIPIAYTDGSSHTITGVRFDPAGANTALTQVSGAAKSTAAGNMAGASFGGVDCYYLKLVGITPGTYTVRITANAGTPVMVATAQLFEFVDQTTPIGTVVNATGVSAAPSSGAISSNTNNMLVGACCAYMASSGADVTTPDTQDLSSRETFGFTSAGLNASHAQGSASHAMTWANSSALFGWACCGVELVAG